MPGTAALSDAIVTEGEGKTVARVYFPELDGLRSVAFLGVYLFHGGAPETLFEFPAIRFVARAFRDNGWVGVQLFFILSGYLITTLLLNEEARFGRIDLRAFWCRRALRIWPLYYWTVFIGFALIPWWGGGLASPDFRQVLGRHLPAFLAFLGNWSIAFRPPAPNDQIGVLWSVCVEEQFYLFVPLLVAWVPRRLRVGTVLTLMAGAIALRWALCRDPRIHTMLVTFNTFAQADTLLGGVLLALLLGTDPKASRIGAWARWLQWPLFAFIAWGFTRSHIAQFDPARRTWDVVAIWACGVGLVIVAVTVRGWWRAVLSSTTLVWLGRISYGLYMYHEIAFCIKPMIAARLGWFPNQEPLLAIGTFALTVGMAAVSYYAFERPFLKWKRAWTRMPSRPV